MVTVKHTKFPYLRYHGYYKSYEIYVIIVVTIPMLF
jgi:hypothetical protein